MKPFLVLCLAMLTFWQQSLTVASVKPADCRPSHPRHPRPFMQI